ncbi:hypothetical protein V2J09_009705 [Rumex salicifolius]
MKRELAFALGARSLILDSVGKTRSNRAPSAHNNGVSGSKSQKRVKKAAGEKPVEFNCSSVAIEDSGVQSSACDEIKQDLIGRCSRNVGFGDSVGQSSIDMGSKEIVSGLANGLLEMKCETTVETPMLAEPKALDSSVAPQIVESESRSNGDIGVEDKHSEIREAVSEFVKTRCDEEVKTTVPGASISTDFSVVHLGVGWSLSNGTEKIKDDSKEGNSNVANDSPLQRKSSLIASGLGNSMVEELHETETGSGGAMDKSSVKEEVALVRGNFKGLAEKPQRRFTRSALKVTDKDPEDLSYLGTNLMTTVNKKTSVAAIDNKDIGEDSNFECTRSESSKKFEVEDLEQIFTERIPRTVRELFETGILEGCKVYYNGGKQGPGIRGIIKGVGILCSCSLCQGSKVVPPSQFEIHACNSYRRAAQYICLENGKNFIDLLQLCREAELKTLVTTIRNAIGPLGKKEMVVCRDCKESFSMDNVADSEPLCNSCTKRVLPSAILQTTAGRTRGSLEKVLSKSSISIQKEKVSVGKAIARRNNKKSTKKASTPKTAIKTGRKRGRPKKPIQADDSSKGPSVESTSQRKAGKITRKDLKLHRLVFDDAGLPDGTELAYFARGEKILEGYKKDSGIFCRCCDEVVSASQFEAHAGFATRRKPYSFIYTSNGVSLHELAVSLLRSRRRDIKESDDLCIICAEGGDLLLCDGCPRAFHTECASLTHQPRGKWFCRYCESAFERDRYVQWNVNAVAAGRVSGVDPIKQISNRSIRMVKDFKDDATSCYLCSGLDFSKSGFGPRTILICDQCEREYHVGCLKTHKMADLEDLPQGEWFCNSNCQMIRSSLQSLLNREAEKLPDNLVDAIRDKLRAHDVEIPSDFDVSWRLLSGQVSSEERATTRPLLSQAISILHEGFGTIVDGVTGRDLIPSIVYGRKVRNREFRGMYCAVLLVNSLIASVAVFRLFGQELVELPLVATRSGYRGKGYFQALFSCIERLFASHHVKSIVLPAAEGAEAVWLKFGFKKMNPDKVSEYKKTYWQITEFTGVAMLEKQVPDCGLIDQTEDAPESGNCA